jgi:hypothetical protein
MFVHIYEEILIRELLNYQDVKNSLSSSLRIILLVSIVPGTDRKLVKLLEYQDPQAHLSFQVTLKKCSLPTTVPCAYGVYLLVIF